MSNYNSLRQTNGIEGGRFIHRLPGGPDSAAIFGLDGRMRPARLLPHLLLLASAVISLPLVAGFLNRVHPAFDSFAHFRLHLAVLLGLAAVALLATRFRREGAVALVLALGAFVATPGTALRGLVLPEATAHQPPPADRAVYRLLHVNARFDNAEPGRLLSLIGRVRPDVVTVNEVSSMWRGRLALIAHAYPYTVFCEGRSAVGGVAILSRRPFSRDAKPPCEDGGALAIARVEFSGQSADIAALHLDWPWPFDQPAQIARLGPVLANLPEATLLTGDFNAVRWSQAVRKIAQDGRLNRVGPTSATWLHRALPKALRGSIGLGIDHVLSGEAVDVHSVAVVEDVASDHLPVITEFSLRPRPTDEGDTPGVQTVRLAARY